MRDILKIAFRNLLRFKRRTILTSLLISVGLVAVLMFIAIAGSFKSMMVAQFTDSMVGHLQVHRRGYIGAMESLPVDRNMRPRMLVKLYEILDATDEIEAWSPRIKFMAMFSNFVSTTSIRVNGVYPDREAAVVPLALDRVHEGGEVVPLVKPGHIQVPELLATPMNLKVGDTVVLVATNKDGSVNGKTFVVQGIIESISGPGGRDGYMHIDDARDLLRIANEGVEVEVLARHGLVAPPVEAPAVKESLKITEAEAAAAADAEPDAEPEPLARDEYVPETEKLFTQMSWGRPAEVSEIAIRLKDVSTLDTVLPALEKKVEDLKNRKGLPIFHIHPWSQFVPFSRIADMIDVLNYYMKVLLILLVAFSILNVLIMAVYERIREIGTISAIGTRPMTILSLFLSEGVLLGVLGTFIGVAVSLVTVWILNMVTITFSFGRQENLVLEPTISSGDVITTGILTILVAVVATLWPAWKASRMDPIVALRHV